MNTNTKNGVSQEKSREREKFSQAEAYHALFDDGQRIGVFARLSHGGKFGNFSAPGAPGAPGEWVQIATQFFCLNPFRQGQLTVPEGGKIVRRKDNILHVQGFTVEQDCMSKALQSEWFRAIFPDGATVECDSGSKSIHHHVRFEQEIEIDSEQHTSLKVLLKAAFPLADWTVATNVACLVRNPGGTRHNPEKPTHGNVQTILHVGRRYTLGEIFDLLRAATVGVVAGAKGASITRARQVAKDWLFDRKEIAEIFKQSKGPVPGEAEFFLSGLGELWRAGYQVAPGTFLDRVFRENLSRRGVREADYEKYLLESCAKAANDKRQAEQAPPVRNTKTRRPSRAGGTANGGGWRRSASEALASQWRDFYERHGVTGIEPDGAGEFRGFTPGQHTNKRGGFRFTPETGLWCDHGNGDAGGYPQDYLIAYCGLSESDAWQAIADYAGIDPAGYQSRAPVGGTDSEINEQSRREACVKIDLGQVFVLLGEPDKDSVTCPVAGEVHKAKLGASGVWACSCGASHDAIDFYARAYNLTAPGVVARVEAREKAVAKTLAESAQTEAYPGVSGEGARAREWLSALPAKSLASLEASTGVGKSHLLLEAALDLVARGEKVVYFTDTLASCNEQASRCSRLAAERGQKVTVGFLAQGEHGGLAADIVFSTYGETGRRGETCGGFAYFHQAVEGRYCLLDEAQEFYAQKMLVSIPLAWRYGLRDKGRKQGTYHSIKACRRFSRRGSCVGCVVGFLRGEGEHGGYYFPAFPAAQLSAYQESPELPALTEADLFDPAKYAWAWGCVYLRQLSVAASIPPKLGGSQLDNTWAAYLASIMATTNNLQIRVQIPSTFDAGGGTPVGWGKQIDLKRLAAKHGWREGDPSLVDRPAAIAPQEDLPAGTTTPQAPCWLPTLTGVDLFPLLQFFPSRLEYEIKIKAGEPKIVVKDFAGAKAIVLASATPPVGLSRAGERVAKAHGWTTTRYVINEIPYQFDVACLKTTARLSDNKIKALAQDLGGGDDPVKNFLLYRNREAAHEGYKHINEAKVLQKIAMLFDAGDYNRQGGVSLKDKAEWVVFCTYPRSAVTKSFDFPEFRVIVVDCQALLPTIAIEGLREGMTREEKDALLFADLQAQIRQIVGRAMRSLLSRLPGGVVQDQVRKVVVLHSLPEWGRGLGVDKSLCWRYQEYYGTWISTRDGAVVESVIDSIRRLLDGDTPQDWCEIDKQFLTTQAAREGKRALSKAQRDQVDERGVEVARKVARKEAKIVELTTKARTLVAAGVPWREISHSLHFDRLPKKDLREIKKSLSSPTESKTSG